MQIVGYEGSAKRIDTGRDGAMEPDDGRRAMTALDLAYAPPFAPVSGSDFSWRHGKPPGTVLARLKRRPPMTRPSFWRRGEPGTWIEGPA